jgi:parallel beta-helix repeat protein
MVKKSIMKMKHINKRAISLIVFLLFSSMLYFGARPVKTAPTEIIVPDQYSTIQAAINNANDGDTVFVKSGIYHEHVVVNKTVSLVGECVSTTIIDGDYTGHVIHIISNHVNVTGFTVRNGGNVGLPDLDAGICLDNVTDCVISRNRAVDAGFLGISLMYSQQNTIASNNVTGSGWNGIHLWGSSRNVISGNIMRSNTDVGINCHSSSNYNNITGNIASDATYGIYTYDANYNRISYNNISMNQYGIHMESSTQNRIYSNNLVNNSQQARVIGDSANTWDDGYSFGGNYWSDYNGTDLNHDGKGDTPYTIDTNNTDRYPLINPFSGIIVPDQYATIQAAINHANDGGTIFVRAGTYYEHVVVNKTITLVGENRDTTIIDGSYIGIVVNITRDGVSISGFTIRRSGTTWNIGGPPYGAGIYMRNVTDCTISGNKLTQDAAGIQLEFGADGNVIASNTMTSVTLGFGTFDASWNSFIGNDVTSNGRGLGLNVNSDYNTISDNRIIALEWVIALHACHYNNITGNYVANGQIGIYLPDSSDNRVYHNQIVNNLQQASLEGFPSHVNYWDDGYPSGGNYWSDYTGTDGNGDGIVDTQYVIDTNNRDHYPLMKPLIQDVAVTDVLPSKTVAGQGYNVDIKVTVANQGNYTETFNVAFYSNTTLIQTKTITLASKTSAIITFTLSTSGFVYGNHTVSAVAQILGETPLFNGTIYVGIPGDLNADRIVDIFDAVLLAGAAGSTPSSSKWNPNADINNDLLVDLFDAVILAGHAGQIVP